MKKIEKYILAALIAAVLLAGFLFIRANSRLKKEIANRTDYETLCEGFIKDYVKDVSRLRDYIYRDEYADSLIHRIDSTAFEFAGKSDIIEYNIYALDRDMYWEQFRDE